jgi:hypothetical protein
MATPVIGYEESLRVVSAEIARRNAKIIDPVVPALKAMTEAPRYFIFNVGPWRWERLMGGNGSWKIPACSEGEDFSAPLTVPALILERVAIEMNKMSNRFQDEGSTFADDLLMRGRGWIPENSLEHWGCAVIDHWPPKAAEIKEAKAKLRITLGKLVSEADDFARSNNRKEISDKMRQAADILGLKRDWLGADPEEEVCPACGAPSKEKFPICATCGREKSKFIAGKAS